MHESLSILLLEDNRAISEAYKGYFEARGNDVVSVYNEDAAVQKLIMNSQARFDLLFIDIDLVGNPQKKADKSGISFAKYAKTTNPNIPIVGHSAYFDNNDLTREELSYFDAWFPKGVKTAERERMFEQALKLAIEKRKERVAEASENQKTDNPDLLDVPVTDNDYTSLGYGKETISIGTIEGQINPFSIWIRGSDEGWELEAIGCPAILAWGENREEAMDFLIEFINSNRDLAELPNEKLSGSSLSVAQFIRDVFGIREKN